jgi:peptidyl-prolyl cis-trans isomerase A (cyclophilin A)
MRAAFFALLAAATALWAADAAAFPQSTHPAMTDPSKAKEKAPDTFKARFETTKGDLVFECTREWAPNGVDRFYNLVRIGFFDDVALFRVVKGFVVQWGIHGDPKVSAKWRDANLPPDPVKQSNTRGMLTYAMAGSPDTRSTQLFLNYGDNKNLDAMGFAPICRIIEGMDVAEKFYGDYGEALTDAQGAIQMQGNAYLRSKWPKLDYIKTATIVGEATLPDRGKTADTAPAGSAGGDVSGTGGAETGGAGGLKPEEGSNVPIYLVGGLLVGAAVILLMTKKKEEPAAAKKEPAKEEGSPSAKKAKTARAEERDEGDAPRPKKAKKKSGGAD